MATNDKREEIIKKCKELIEKNGFARVGYAYKQINGIEDEDKSTHKSVAMLMQKTGNFGFERLENGDYNVYILPSKKFPTKYPALFAIIMAIIGSILQV